jgi:hypothetical protein
MLSDFFLLTRRFEIIWVSFSTTFSGDSRMQLFTSSLLLLFTILVLNLLVKPINQTLGQRNSVIVIHVLGHTSVQVQRLVNPGEQHLVICNQLGNIKSLLNLVVLFCILGTWLVIASNFLSFVKCFLHLTKFELLLTF